MTKLDNNGKVGIDEHINSNGGPHELLHIESGGVANLKEVLPENQQSGGGGDTLHAFKKCF